MNAPLLECSWVWELTASLGSRFLCSCSRRKVFLVWSLSLSSCHFCPWLMGLWIHIEQVASLVHMAALHLFVKIPLAPPPAMTPPFHC